MKALSLAMLFLAGHALAADPDWRQVQPGTLTRVLTDIAGHGYVTGATTNQARFVADFLFALADTPELTQHPFRIDPSDFFNAWTEVTGTEPDQAPVAIGNVLEFKQQFHVTPGPDQLIEPAPRRALQVRVEWPDRDGLPERYEYRDRLSDPEVRMRHERRIDYLLLDYGDFIAYENIRGVAGRPDTGGLGALFSVLGMARIESTRFTVADDGTQINLARVRKLFSFTAMATIDRHGNAERGLPEGRDDLQRLAERLQLDIVIQPGTPPSP